MEQALVAAFSQKRLENRAMGMGGANVPLGTGKPGVNARSGQGPDAEEDRLLLAAVARQDQQAFRKLVDRHIGTVLAIARRMLRDDAEAEDVAQETMLRLWRSGGSLDLGANGLRPWLRRVASNLCIDRVRGSRRTVVTDEVPEEAEPPSQMVAIEKREMAKRVQEALQTLPERQRLALTLFHHEGLSQVEVGDIMGISDEAVESLLARARRSLKAALQTEWKSLLTQDDGS
jgi:RNA polymerase sigma-70 factor (ECF subfamily)